MGVHRGDVLVCGARVAGPTLASWMHRYGYQPTVVERTPTLRRGWGGHAIDLFGPAIDITERMGVLPQVRDARTRTKVISFVRPGRRPIDVDFTRLVAGISHRRSRSCTASSPRSCTRPPAVTSSTGSTTPSPR